MRDFPLRAWIFTTAVAAGAAAATIALLALHPLEPVQTIAFGVIFLLAELAPVPLSHMSYSVSFIIALAAIILFGPGAAAIVASFGALDLSVRKRPDWLGRTVFNGAQLALSTAVSGAVYEALGGDIGGVSAHDFPTILIAAAGATLAYFLVNGALVTGMVVLVRRVPAREIWRSNLFLVAITYFCFAALGLLLATLYHPIGWGIMVFLLIPLLVARSAMRTSTTMREAFDATIRSVIAAIEAKDPYTRGHMERVARLAEMTAREYGLAPQRARRVFYAAMMHDVGKLVVQTRILQKPGKLTAEEYDHMKIHPIKGEEIVAEIDLLEGVIDGVRHHHERMDGGGYPDGLAGEDIPLVARLIMVSDAFDSMTSTRSYRPAKDVESGIKELRRCAGNQFDSRAIDALERAIARHGWETHAEEFVGEQTARPEVPVHAALARAE